MGFFEVQFMWAVLPENIGFNDSDAEILKKQSLLQALLKRRSIYDFTGNYSQGL